jgi:hypothetical protein
MNDRKAPNNSMPTLARRLVPVIALGSAAGALVFALDRQGGGESVMLAAPGDTEATSVEAVDATASESTAANTSPGTAASAASTSVASTVASTVSTTVPTAPAQSSGTKCQLYNGPTEWHRFGPVQVQAGVTSSGKICSVKLIQEPGDRRSQSINDWAVPVLVERSLADQTARVDVVSGATLTSVAYSASLQAIIDAATK